MNTVVKIDGSEKEPWEMFLNVLRHNEEDAFADLEDILVHGVEPNPDDPEVLSRLYICNFHLEMFKPLFASLTKLRPELIAYCEARLAEDKHPPAFHGWWEQLTLLMQQHAKAPNLMDDFSYVRDCLMLAEPYMPNKWQVELDDEQRVMLLQLCECMSQLGIAIAAYGKQVNEPFFKANPKARREAA